MPAYAWKGRNADGNLVEGRLEQPTPGGVADILRDQGITPVEIRETAAKAEASVHPTNVTLFRREISSIDLLGNLC